MRPWNSLDSFMPFAPAVRRSAATQVYGIRHYIQNFVERRWTAADVAAAEAFYRQGPPAPDARAQIARKTANASPASCTGRDKARS